MKPFWYHILLALADGPLHGAGIRRRVEVQSHGVVTLYPAMLYGSLDELADQDWIEEETEPPPGQHARWRFYSLTAAGRSALADETARLEAVVVLARSALGAT